jgi:hypothetical protein
MKNLKKIFTVIFFALFLTTVYSQPYTIWQKQYAGPSNLQDSSIGITANANGQVFVTGWSNGLSSADIVTMQYNAETGDTLWVKRYAGALEDKPTSIISDNNFVYVTGWSFSPAPNNRDIITIKYNASTGDTVYTRKYNGTANGGDYGWAIAVDGSGNAYVSGRTDIGGQQKMIVIKYDPSGNIAYSTIYTGPLSNSFDEAHEIKVDGSGNAYVTGISGISNNNTTYDYLTLKLSSSGTVMWGKKYNGNFNSEDNPSSLVIDDAGANVFVGGSSFRIGSIQDYVTIKYNADTGDSLAAAIYNAASNIDGITAMTKDNSGNIYVTGNSFGATNYNYATIKYNSSLQQQWVTRTTNTAGPEYAVAIAYDPTGYIYVSGSSTGSGTGTDFYTERYNASNGARDWFVRDNGGSSGNDVVSGMVVTGPDNVYVTGSAIFGNLNIYTIRYSQTNSVRPISGEVPVKFLLEQNYPNPFNPSTKFNFDLPENTHVNIVVYDMLGREVEMLVNKDMKAGRYEVTWNAVNAGSGVYFYKLITSSYTETKKMVLQK